MTRSRVPLGRRSRSWLALSGIAAMAASGCAAQPVPVAAVAAGDQVVAGPVKPGQKFTTYIKNGKLYCADCNTELNADGHHKAANLLINNLKALRTGKVLQLPQVKPGSGKLTLADTLGFTMARLGMSDIIKEHVAGQAKNDGADPDAAVRLVPDYVGTYDEAVAYVNANSTAYNDACCVPDGADTPDGPF